MTYQNVDFTASHGRIDGHLVTVDLRNPHVSVDLLHGTSVTDREPVSALADAQHAVAGVNGDFFNISETHPGITPTGSSDGPAIAGGHQVKAAVPNGQRFGPGLPPGTSTRDVIGVGYDRKGRLDTLSLKGTVRTGSATLPLGGFNQYALPENGVGAYTSDWGSVSRARSTCGTDTVREAPCSTDTYEVTVRAGRVVSVADTPGSGPIAPGSTVLVGREKGADELRALTPGARVRVSHHLAGEGRVPLRFAVGGFPVLRDGSPLAGLNTVTAATRTAAGVGSHGRMLYLLALDGDAETSAGLTIGELATAMRGFGADDAVNLDGGGSTTLVTRDPGAAQVTVRNHPGGGAERPVPNGIGVFSRR
nr:phosphodiester glycosidase family protein [Streptomyces sp. TS71-3]